MNIENAKNYGSIGVLRQDKGIFTYAKKFKANFLKRFPSEKDDHFFHHTYTTKIRRLMGALDFYIRMWEFSDLSPSTLRELRSDYYRLYDPVCNRTKEKFIKNCDNLLGCLKYADKYLLPKLNLLSKLECHRMFEAMECLDKGRNLAAVVMSVSAVEYRLHKILQKENKTLYKKEFERATLGGIIELFRLGSRYTDKKYKKFKQILPNKHKPLIEMLNIYRIFSAHPKDELISSQTAKTIISLSFLLLLDSDLKQVS